MPTWKLKDSEMYIMDDDVERESSWARSREGGLKTREHTLSPRRGCRELEEVIVNTAACSSTALPLSNSVWVSGVSFLFSPHTCSLCLVNIFSFILLQYLPISSTFGNITDKQKLRPAPPPLAVPDHDLFGRYLSSTVYTH